MTESNEAVVLVTQNEGNVVDTYEFIQGQGRIIFVDWDEVSTRMADFRHGDMLYDASDWADDMKFLRRFKGTAQNVLSSWLDLCEEHDFDPLTGEPFVCGECGSMDIERNEHDDAWCGQCGERLLLTGAAGGPDFWTAP